MAPPTQTVPQLFTEMQKSIQKQDFKNVVRCANLILHTKEGNHDQDALHCKTVALIEQEKYADCIRGLNEIENEFYFEKAYCFYRLHDNENALKVLENSSDEKCEELRAQIYFRLERWDEAYQIYQNALRNTVDSFEPERIANLIACAAMVTQFRPDLPHEDFDHKVAGDSYEAAFNEACRLTGTSQYAEAQDELVRAEKLCKVAFEDQEEDLNSELASIRFQLGYLHQIQGKKNEALSAYNLVLNTSDDAVTSALTNHNLGTLNKDGNILDSRKKFKGIQATNVDAKLTKAQREITKKNRALLALYSGKPSECRKILGNSTSADDEIVNASILFQEKEFGQASSMLIKWGKKHAKTELALIKAAAMFVQSEQLDNCANMLLILPPKVLHHPVITDLLISIYTELDQGAKAVKVLDEAIVFHKTSGGAAGGDNLVKMLRRSARYKLDSGDAKAAAQLLEEIHKNQPNDVAVLAELIGAYSTFDKERAEKTASKLPPLEKLTEGLNIEEVEQWAKVASWAKKPIKTKVEEKPVAPSATVADEVDGKTKNLEKKRKKRKPKYPKTFNPDGENGPIDPERWIPLRDRTYYKGKRRDKKGKIGKGNQGTAGQEKITAALDMSQKTSVQSPKPSRSLESPSGPRQERPTGKPKPKKKAAKGKGKKKF